MRTALAILIFLVFFSIAYVKAEPVKLEVATCPPADPYSYVLWIWEETQSEGGISFTIGLGSAIEVSPPTLYLPVGYKGYISVRAEEGVSWSVRTQDSGLSVQSTGSSVLVEARSPGTHWVVFEVNGMELLYPVVISSGSLGFSGPYAELEYNSAIREEVIRIWIPESGESFLIIKNNFPFQIEIEGLGVAGGITIEGPRVIPPYGEVKYKITGDLVGELCCDYLKFARGIASREELEGLHAAAVQFIQETRAGGRGGRA